MRRNKTPMARAMKKLEEMGRSEQQLIKADRKGRIPKEKGRGILSRTVGDHKIISAGVAGTLVWFAVGSPAQDLENICNSNSYCSAKANITTPPSDVESVATFASKTKQGTPVTGIGSYAITGVKLLPGNLIGVGAKFTLDPVKFESVVGRNEKGRLNQKKSIIDTTTKYVLNLCTSKVGILKTAGQTDLDNIIAEAQSDANSLVSPNAVVTPQMLQSADNGYLKPDPNSKNSNVVVYDAATVNAQTKTVTVVRCTS